MSKSNFRRGGAPSGSAWRSLSSFERSLSLILRAARPEDWTLASRDSSLAERPVVVSVVVARSLLDVGNFHKSVLDAGEGVLFVSDAEVRSVVALGERARGSQRGVLGFAQVAPGASLTALSAAAALLTEASLADFSTGCL